MLKTNLHNYASTVVHLANGQYFTRTDVNNTAPTLPTNRRQIRVTSHYSLG